jgi:hypothetical protein
MKKFRKEELTNATVMTDGFGILAFPSKFEPSAATFARTRRLVVVKPARPLRPSDLGFSILSHILNSEK